MAAYNNEDTLICKKIYRNDKEINIIHMSSIKSWQQVSKAKKKNNKEK